MQTAFDIFENDPRSVHFWLAKFDPKSANEVFEKWPEQITGQFIACYGSDLVTHEIQRCFVYYKAHPERWPNSIRAWTVVAMRWFENAYLHRQKRSA